MKRIKVGDEVIVIAGKDKGKSGKVIKTLKNEEKLVIEGINIVKKHVKPNNQNDKGGIFDIEAPIHVSNVKLVETKKSATKTKKESKNK